MDHQVSASGSHVLEISLLNSGPVPAAAFGDSFKSLQDEYQLFVDLVAPDEVTCSEVQLFVTKVREGSIVAELVALAPLAIPFLENANSIIQFAKHLKNGFDVLLHRPDESRALQRRSLTNLNNIVEPVARDGASQLNFQARVDGDVHVHIHLDSTSANAIQNVARKALEPNREKVPTSHTGVLMYLYQARNDPRSNAGDRAIIESITPRPVKMVFADNTIKQRVLTVAENLFRLAFVVDVEVQTIGGRPALYKVIDLIDTFEKPLGT